jgi:2-phospho-L-lactate transferase/gluconeogenesis factor (CofD/UPF0052 family)
VAHSLPGVAELEAEAAIERRRSLRVVCIGGGTGLSTLLRGLKRYVWTPPGSLPLTDSRCKDSPCSIRELSAVVTVTDDGGSSGRLREDLKMLPPGDVRNCMVALSEDELLLAKQFREFVRGSALEHHGGFRAGGADVVADSGDAGANLSGDQCGCVVGGADG